MKTTDEERLLAELTKAGLVELDRRAAGNGKGELSRTVYFGVMVRFERLDEDTPIYHGSYTATTEGAVTASIFRVFGTNLFEQCIRGLDCIGSVTKIEGSVRAVQADNPWWTQGPVRAAEK